MNKMKSPTENGIKNCLSCSHFGYCIIYWGADCKRQGGKRIPRMKSMPFEERQNVDKQEWKKPDKPWKPTIEIFESIRTKVANW
jgi:hypothetical protein